MAPLTPSQMAVALPGFGFALMYELTICTSLWSNMFEHASSPCYKVPITYYLAKNAIF